MKLRIEIAEDAENEVILRCRKHTDEIALLVAAIEGVIKENGELKLYIGNTEYYVSNGEILFFETYDGKVYAHSADKMYRSDHKLFELEALMPPYFVRISKSAVVNVKSIESIRRELTGNGEITFRKCDKKTYFSRAYYKVLKDRIEEVRHLK